MLKNRGHAARLSPLRALLLLLLLAGGQPPAQATGILVVASSDAELYRSFIERFMASLNDARPGLAAADVTFTFLDTDEPDDSELAASDIIVTIGSKAALEISARRPQAPLLHTLLPESVYRSLAASPGASCAARSAIFIDQPLARQAALAQALFPAAARYGVMLGPTSRQREAEVTALQNALAGENGRKIVVTSAGVDKDISVTANGLLHQVDLLLAVNDPLVLNRENAKWLLYSAYQRRLPVIGFSRAYVKAGAAGAVYSEPGQMARQAAEIVRRRVTEPAACLPAAAFPRYFSVAINQSVCSSLGGTSCDEAKLGRRLAEGESGP